MESVTIQAPSVKYRIFGVLIKNKNFTQEYTTDNPIPPIKINKLPCPKNRPNKITNRELYNGKKIIDNAMILYFREAQYRLSYCCCSCLCCVLVLYYYKFAILYLVLGLILQDASSAYIPTYIYTNITEIMYIYISFIGILSFWFFVFLLCEQSVQFLQPGCFVFEVHRLRSLWQRGFGQLCILLYLSIKYVFPLYYFQFMAFNTITSVVLEVSYETQISFYLLFWYSFLKLVFFSFIILFFLCHFSTANKSTQSKQIFLFVIFILTVLVGPIDLFIQLGIMVFSVIGFEIRIIYLLNKSLYHYKITNSPESFR